MPDSQHEVAFSPNPAENYERFFVPSIGRPIAEDLVALAAPQPGERVLDVGCGTGIVARLAAEHVGSTGSVTGLDINPGMLAVARSASPERHIEWREGNAESIPLPDESFDVVLCQMSLQFIGDKGAALREMRRVLDPAGRVVLNLPGPQHPLFDVLAQGMEHHVSPEAAGFVRAVFSLHDAKELERLLDEAGFRDVEISADVKLLSLPAPKRFLWEYVMSTPLAGSVAGVDEASLAKLEAETASGWSPFEENGGLSYGQRMVSVTARP